MAVEIPLTRGQVALVDEQDEWAASQYKWHAIPAARTWYACRWTRRSDGRGTTQALHQLLTGWALTDHINGNGLDNRRCNLRAATTAQNLSNMRKHRGSSRFKGVSWFKRTQQWRAYIELSGRQIFLGHFHDEGEAALAYDVAAREHFGEFAALNFPEPGERAALDDQPRLRPIGTTAWRRAKAGRSMAEES